MSIAHTKLISVFPLPFFIAISFMVRASLGEKADNTFDSQVVQYEPAHQGSINTITNLSPDLCVSGGSDQVNLWICRELL